MSTGIIKKVAGRWSLRRECGTPTCLTWCVVSGQRLIGEIIEMHGDQASVQVYEETAGLGPENRWNPQARR